MTTGTVRWFSGEKGYGFIHPDDHNTDVFVHVTAAEKSGIHDLKQGEKVSFDIINDARRGKQCAINLKKI